MTEETYTLRPSTMSDFEFIRDIYHRTLMEEVEPIWGWDDTFQNVQAGNLFKTQEFEIIEHDTKSIGFLESEVLSGDIYMKSISIFPEFQGQKIGTRVLSGLIERATGRGLGVVLKVLKTNHGAKKLYEHLGFKTTGETARHFEMKRPVI